MKNPVAVFDSGIGGLTVVKEISGLLPREKIIYFGDTARVPYGTKSKQVIRDYALQICRFLEKFEPKITVIACHSVSSLALVFLRRNFPRMHFLDVLTPSVDRAVKMTSNGKIGVIGTPATVSSNMYEILIHRINPEIRIYSRACPLLVPLAEEGWFGGPIPDSIVRYYISGLLGKNIDTLILACTHYPLLKNVIRRVAGAKIRLVDASEVTGIRVKEFLDEHHILNAGRRQKPVFYFSDVGQHHSKVLKLFWADGKITVRKKALE